MSIQDSNNADLWRGTAIAVALVGLVLLVFVIIANSRLWHRVTAPRRVPVSTVPMAPAKGEEPYLHAMGAPREDAAGSPDGGGADGETPGKNAVPAGGAGQALRQALSTYRPSLNRTATVTITTSGRASFDDGGPLTSDGLPMEEVHDATLVTGKAPAR